MGISTLGLHHKLKTNKVPPVMEQSESEHVIDITSSSGASSSSSSEDTVNQSNSRLNQDLPSTSMTAPVFQHSFSISNGGNTRNTSFGRRESGHGRRNPLNSGYWISTEIVITVSQIIAAIVVLCLSRHELPQAPLFTWVIGYASGCVATLPLLFWRFHNCNRQDPSQNRQSSAPSRLSAITASLTSSIQQSIRTIRHFWHPINPILFLLLLASFPPEDLGLNFGSLDVGV
ncbi:uncharacterized protein LOC112529036 [Cynara cardunculus var. scolymus]|uniref:uncharacterized protein LOC112529036 n=1 Tax=Cynara cardunculus var. scolymus TaxID=59895 RepID=UPI000D626441|nr:uncharacterized protein LOC112529036 [Cynara cardunculus var. scolymus]